MELPFTVVFEPPTGREFVALLRKPALWIAVLLIAALTVAGYRWRQAREAQRAAASADVSILTNPAGAAIAVDGHRRGASPLRLAVSPGKHTVAVSLAGYTNWKSAIQLAPRQHLELDVRLWLSTADLEPIRPALPGATISDVRFLADGQLVMTQLLPGSRWQLWVIGQDTRQLGPATAEGPLALSDDGTRVAYLASSAPVNPTRLDQLRVSGPDAAKDTLVFQLPAASSDERLEDVCWTPDGNRLAVAIQQQLQAGGTYTRLVLADPRTGHTTELAVLPSEFVPGSAMWDGAGRRLAFLTKAGERTALSVVDVQNPVPHYLGDLSSTDAGAVAFAPIAWGGSTDFGFAVLDQLRPPTGLLPSQPAPALFTYSNGSVDRYGPGASGGSPAWLDEQTLVTLARQPHDGLLVVRQIDRSGHQTDLSTLPMKASAYAARWDLPRDEALIATSGDAGSSGQTSFWLARFRTAS